MQRRRQKGMTKKIAVSLILLFFGGSLLIVAVNRQIAPNIDAISRLKAEGVVNALINETIQETFSALEREEELFSIEYGENGRVQMVQANTVLINQAVSDLTVCLQKKYDGLTPQRVQIPLGSILGSLLLSQTERGVEISILPMSVSKCDYVTGFESQGINQTKYKIFVEIQSDVRILQPFSQENFCITSKMLVSEVVILGDVPENYVHVPKEDILDVT